MIKAIVFDLGNTLFHIGPAGYSDAEWERRLGLPAGEMGSRIWGSDMDRAAMVGAVGFEEFWQWVGDTLGLTARQLAELDEGMWADISMPPQLTDWLARLRGDFRIAGLSNAWSDARQRSAGYGVDQLLEFVAYSAEIGFAKPDPRASRSSWIGSSCHRSR